MSLLTELLELCIKILDEAIVSGHVVKIGIFMTKFTPHVVKVEISMTEFSPRGENWNFHDKIYTTCSEN